MVRLDPLPAKLLSSCDHIQDSSEMACARMRFMAYPTSDTVHDLAPANPSSACTAPADHNGFVIHAPGIDREEILERVRTNAAKRSPLPHPAAVIGRAHLQEERQAILQSLKDLQHSMRDCGLVDSHRKGLLGRVDLHIKRAVRKLFQRHLLQQHRVHLKLMKFLGRVLDYLETEDRVIRLRLDRCEQTYAQAVCALSNRPESSGYPSSATPSARAAACEIST